MTDALVFALFLGLPCAYLLRCLHLREVDSHEGPAKDMRRVVLFASGHVQQVCLWDWIRRLFGAYRVEGYTWNVEEHRAEVWTCTHCLSLWCALPFAAYLLLVEPFWRQGLNGLMVTAAIAVIAQILYRVIYET